MMSEKDIPVLLLTGYLGSGKTTLVNRILNNRRGIKFAVIVNDIGEVNIDAGLIEKGGVVGKKDESLVALQNGCICCTLKMDLVEQLAGIVRQRKFDYIVIEASGICEPEPIAQTICSIPSMIDTRLLPAVPRLDCVVTVVDALRLQSEFGCGENLMRKDIDEEDLENLVIQQVEFCNKILLNKASEVSDQEKDRIRHIIHALQGEAEIIECDYCDVELDKILHTDSFDFDKVITSATWLKEVEGRHDDDDDDDDDEEEEEHHHDGDGHHHHHEHEGGEVEEYGIGTYVYTRREPFDLNLFDFFVDRAWPKSVIRAKGICYFADEPDICYLFEQAGKQISLKNAGQWYATMPKDELFDMMERDENLRRDWDDEYGDRMQKIVFIGQHLDKKALKDALDACIV